MGDNQPGFKAAQTKVNFVAGIHRFENCTQFVSLHHLCDFTQCMGEFTYVNVLYIVYIVCIQCVNFHS